ncbi:transcriptional adapter 2-alpha-like isoform X1 [Diorhabda carinulata]|uniref:transcriptional adapter 2-alpha-like isoform X1 n=1 Tax=Diorhabda carinulata TaxID=1163345 RepID=UPI0025A28E5A|nr:transcriptional adapter 2-alpha-like isoform X1 [Diorhabda carinulata]
MANTATDLTEEDAADLQFPKEDDLSTFSRCNIFDNSDSTYCANCYCEVQSKYILCEKCKVNICLSCFSNGAEFLNHKNDHDYRVLSTNFVLFENSDWTAEEELKLLDCISNYGNWNLITQELPNRSVNEIIQHYEYFYLERNGCKGFPKINFPDVALFPELVVPYRFRLADTDEPPRYLSNTVGFKSLAGYNPARSDFEIEFDKGAEDILSNLEFVDEDDPHYELLTKLQCSLVEAYNRRLQERQRWKNLIRSHGLLLVRKTHSWLKRYDNTINKNIYEKMIRFMQLCKPMKFEMLMEGLHRVGELKLHISRLINLRKIGITTLAEGRLYFKLKQSHEANKKSLKLFRQDPALNWKACKDSNFTIISKCNRRRSFAPIEISGMPGYSKLSPQEADLCSTVRLVPVTYFQLRDTLVSECRKNGSVSLQTARKLLKIDVNKTRKLYDFLLQEGYIQKTSSSIS